MGESPCTFAQNQIPNSFISIKYDGLTYAYGVVQMGSVYCPTTGATTWYKYQTNIKHRSRGEPAVINHRTGYKEWWIDGEMVDCAEWQNLTKFIHNHKSKYGMLTTLSNMLYTLFKIRI